VRVSEEERVAGQRREAGQRGDFAAAFDRAERRRAEAGRTEAGHADAVRDGQRAGEMQAVARDGEARALRAEVAGARLAPSADGPGAVSGAGAGGHAGSVGSPGAPPGPAPVGGAGVVAPAGEPARAALVQAVRALPPVVEAFGASGQAGLSIDFGGALRVELRQAPGGVELRLSAPDALRVSARLELAGLCRTLAARGVAVVRAEVGGGRPGRGRW